MQRMASVSPPPAAKATPTPTGAGKKQNLGQTMNSTMMGSTMAGTMNTMEATRSSPFRETI
jgi:hypothetical protein